MAVPCQGLSGECLLFQVADWAFADQVGAQDAVVQDNIVCDDAIPGVDLRPFAQDHRREAPGIGGQVGANQAGAPLVVVPGSGFGAAPARAAILAEQLRIEIGRGTANRAGFGRADEKPGGRFGGALAALAQVIGDGLDSRAVRALGAGAAFVLADLVQARLDGWAKVDRVTVLVNDDNGVFENFVQIDLNLLARWDGG